MKHIELWNANSVDAIKGVSIIIIVFYHIACIAPNLELFVESMALPAFMFSSGLLYFQYTRKKYYGNSVLSRLTGGGNFVVLKLKRLIVPFLSLGISYSLLKCAYFYMVGTICEIDLASKFLNLIVCPRDSLAPFVWFLLALFLIFLIVHATNDRYLKVLSVVSVFMYLFHQKMPYVFCLQDVSKYLLFFMCGNIALRMRGKFASKNNMNCILLFRFVYFILYVFAINLIAHSIVGRYISLIGKYSGAIYFLHAFVIAIITGVLGDKHYLIIGLLAISVPIVIDIITRRYNFSMFRRVFLDTK